MSSCLNHTWLVHSKKNRKASYRSKCPLSFLSISLGKVLWAWLPMESQGDPVVLAVWRCRLQGSRCHMPWLTHCVTAVEGVQGPVSPQSPYYWTPKHSHSCCWEAKFLPYIFSCFFWRWSGKFLFPTFIFSPWCLQNALPGRPIPKGCQLLWKGPLPANHLNFRMEATLPQSSLEASLGPKCYQPQTLVFIIVISLIQNDLC